MGDTLRSPTISTLLQRIAQQAVDRPTMVFQTLAHHMTVDFLREAFYRLRKKSAPGIDKVTVRKYGVQLEENLRDLHERLRSGRYQAPPVKRVWIAKEDGKQRPLGMPTLEDKIVQRAVHMLMSTIYEQDFHDLSWGFRQGRSAHKAIHQLRESCFHLKTGWIIDADISAFFDSIDHRRLVTMIRERINDGALIQLIGKWLNAGVLEEGKLSYPEDGTPQGGVISPLLANIFLHHVLDQWFVRDVKPRMKGHCFLVRYADDFVIGFELENDARRVMEVLPKRFNRFGLTIHPTKTRLVDFRSPEKCQAEEATFNFLGFTHYWGKSRSGGWVIKRQTSGKRYLRAKVSMWNWCKKERHTRLVEQHHVLRQKLNGHYQYYGIRGNFRMIEKFYRFTRTAWHNWLSRRSSESYITLYKFEKLLSRFPLPKPMIKHQV